MRNANLIFRLSLPALFALLIVGAPIGHSRAQSANQPNQIDALRSPIRIVDGYPQFQLDGQPFFVHSAAFFYNRIPRDALLLPFDLPLIIGENNQVQVAVMNHSLQPLKGRLTLTVSRSLKKEMVPLDVNLTPQASSSISFNVPVNGHAVDGDLALLRASLLNETDGHCYSSVAVTAEIRKRFDWRIYPNATWSLRADTPQSMNPPLIYPSDDNATVAKFNMRFNNNTAQEITLSRKTALVDSLPLKLNPDEEYLSTYTYNFAPGTKSALNPFKVIISDGKLTEIAEVNFVALRKGEAVAFAYDIDRDGFSDYVLENEHLRLIISPNAGARSFALINKHTDTNVFTSVGGLRDKFVELDPQDPTQNPRRKRGMYGTFNRPYTAEIVEGMGQRVSVRLSYDAPDIYAGGARIERAVRLNAGDEFFTVDYSVTPTRKTVTGKQAFWSANSIVIGDPNLRARRVVTANYAFDFAAAKARVLDVQSGWVAAPLDDRYTLALMWRSSEVDAAEIEMKDFSSVLNVKFKPFMTSETYSYRLGYYLGRMGPAQLTRFANENNWGVEKESLFVYL